MNQPWLLWAARWMPLSLALFQAYGQTSLSLRQAVDQAIQAHPALSVAGGRIDVATGLRRQAGLRLNPQLTLQTENWQPYARRDFLPSRDTDNFVYLTQVFETAGKRELRNTAAVEAVRRAELDRELMTRQIAAAVKSAYWRAAVAAKIRNLLTENLANFQQIVDFHQIRVQEGAMAEADLIRVRLESERLRIDLNNAALEAEQSRIVLFREMGQTEFPDVMFSEDPDKILLPPAGTVEFALENRTEIQIAAQAIEQARAGERVQRANAKPDVEASFGLKRTNGLNTVMGIVQLPLPLANRNEGAIAAASAQVRMAQSELAATTAIVRAEVRARTAEVEMRRQQVTGTFRSLLDKAEQSSRIARAAYREGGWELLRLLDAERARIEVHVLYYRTLLEYHVSAVALETALGVMP